MLAGFLGMALMANAGTRSYSAPRSAPSYHPPASHAAPHVNSRPSSSHPNVNRPGPSFNRPGPSANHPITPVSHPAAPKPTLAKGTNERHTISGSTVRTRADGKPSDIHDAKRGMDVHHGLNGGRRVSAEDHNNNRTVYQKGRAGYVQHPYSYHGHDFAHRTYAFHGHVYDRSYMGYPYHGVYLNIYAPGYFYSPYYYGWAYYPWGEPVVYGWGFPGSPWYGYYGYYFSPFDSYPSASYWLTDYMISEDLQAGYNAHIEGGETDGEAPAVAGPPLLTPEVKQMIADEVKKELSLEYSETNLTTKQQDLDPGSSGLDRLFYDASKGKPHILVVGSSLDVVDKTQTECSLSDGDVLQLQAAPAADAAAADLVVLASKGGKECQKQATVSVPLADLQEMQNHMRVMIDQGLQELQNKQGKDGLPAIPSTVPEQPTQAPYAAVAPSPDLHAPAEIDQQAGQADQADKDVTAEATQPSIPPQ